MQVIDTYLQALRNINNQLSSELPEVAWDLPENYKIKYALWRADQMYKVKWSALSTLEGGDRTILGGKTYHGLPYSSVKQCDLFIGHNISFETFFTAVKNPASVLYTKTCYNTKPHTNATLWYGTVCSSFVTQSLGISDVRPVTRFLSTMDGVTAVTLPTDIKLMDFLVTPPDDSGHTELITGILRNKTGEIVGVEITDAAPICVRRRYFKYADFLTHLSTDSLSIYRYNITMTTYESSPFVQVPGEMNPCSPYIYNTVLMTDYGNKANYKKGVNTEINIMSTNAQTLVIKRNGTVVATINVSSITTTTINSISYTIYKYANTVEGKYEAYCTMQDGTQSAKVEWIVYSYTASLASNTVVNGGDITVNFAGVNCTPLSINGNYWTWSLAWGMDYNAWSSVRWLQKLTPQEVTAGQAVTNYTDTNSEGIYGVKVYFQTEFGIVPSDPMVVTFT